MFVAAWPPDHVLDLIEALRRPAHPGLRWTTRDQWHVTLRFLGEADVGPALDALLGVSPQPVEAVLGPALGRFGQRVLHVPVAGLDAVAADAARATARVGRPPDDRPFAGHLTLARVARAASVDLRPLSGGALSARWPVEDLCLVESSLSAAGAGYRVVARVPLPAGR